MQKVLKFAEALGFTDTRVLKTINKGVLAFGYENFDIKALRAAVGKHKKHDPDTGQFIFVIEKGKRVIRVDTNKRVVLIGDGERAFKEIFKSVP
jgi:hypothetical protein